MLLIEFNEIYEKIIFFMNGFSILMRLIVKFMPVRHVPASKINKHTIQGMIYSLLENTEFEELHRKKGFKFFTFSDIFPPGDLYPKKEKNIIISSPNAKLINTLYSRIKEKKYIYLSDEAFIMHEMETFRLRHRGKFITGSPVVVYKDSRKNIYLSFEKKDSVDFFIKRITDNAVRKYEEYYREKIEIDAIFDEVVFNKEVAVRLAKDGKEFIIVGSMWYLMSKTKIDRKYNKLYNLIMDCGIGEKNSLGFGFLNPLKENEKFGGKRYYHGGCIINLPK